MKSNKISSRYARAFFDFLVEQGFLEAGRADMALLAAVNEENRELQNMLKSPVIGNRKKESILREIFSRHLHPSSMEFILLLTRNRREQYLAEIALAFEALYREHQGIRTVKLVTAAPVNEHIRKELVRRLTEDTGATIELEEAVNPDLVGGFILQTEDKKFDASLRRELDQLKKEFDVNLYIREF
ncbi:MAG TPA: ATP synthase F1 subunit delta [Bacteroidales bacterium]|nr:ATP synthase F1 subunit delta [Bacteroidales bacterium]HRZ76140.1 ATP synthase F1 subunit delta [Bacteroidales bacterium]